MIPRRWPNVLLWLVHICIVAAVALYTNHVVPEPYMDEIFHVGQAQTYCRGDWKTWDPKLTTPPGLYLPSAILSYLLKLPICSVPALRAVNAVLVAVMPLLLADLLAAIRPGSHTPSKHAYEQVFKEALAISTFPLVYFFGFLYYTDVASVVMVLLAYRQALLESYRSSAALGLASLLFRQTNILWIAYIAFEALNTRMMAISGRMREKPHLRQRESLQRLHIGDAPVAVLDLLGTSIRDPTLTGRIVLPYVPVGLAFLAFLRWNKGIVLGDKTMHVAAVHIPQIYYFAAFSGAMAAPLLLLEARHLRSTFRTVYGSPLRIATFVCLSLGVAWTLENFTIEHPFLLADNRHYPFYVWRRIINLHPASRYLLAPVYVFATVLLFLAIAQARTWSLLPLLTFVTVTALALVPSPLIEFRYFIVPYILLRLHLRPTRRLQLIGEGLMYAAVNAVTLAVFWWRPFLWKQEPGRSQRFMW